MTQPPSAKLQKAWDAEETATREVHAAADVMTKWKKEFDDIAAVLAATTNARTRNSFELNQLEAARVIALQSFDAAFVALTKAGTKRANARRARLTAEEEQDQQARAAAPSNVVKLEIAK